MDPEVRRRWIGRYGPYVSAVVAARLAVERLLSASTDATGRCLKAADLRLLAAAFDVLRATAELAEQAAPTPDDEARAALQAALDALRAAAWAFAHPGRRLDAVRELLTAADVNLLRWGDRMAPAGADPLAGPASGRQLQYSHGR
jgi:hypothetical protein